MSVTNSTRNPYFDPNPTWMYRSLEFVFILESFMAALGIYLVLYKSPTNMTKTFKYLLVLHTVLAALFVFDLTIGSPPLWYLPYIASQFNGLFQLFGLPVRIQGALLVSLIIVAASVLVPLFYYRMDVLLPPGHILNNFLIRFSIYSFCYLGSTTLPFIALILASYYDDQMTLKKKNYAEFRVDFDLFWSPDVLIADFRGNPFAYIIIPISFGYIFFAVVGVGGCIYFIYSILQSRATLMSANIKTYHRDVLVTLLATVSLLSTVLILNEKAFVVGLSTCVLCLVMAYFILSNSWRTDYFNAFLLCAAMCGPMFGVTIIATYKPYRKAVHRGLQKLMV